MEFYESDSSLVSRIEYDRHYETLVIYLRNYKEPRHVYLKVPPMVLSEMISSESIGKFYLNKIKGKYKLFQEQQTTKKSNTMIKMMVIGNLGKDALVNNVNGKSVINFTVAHTEKFKDSQGNQKDKTTWVDCSYWTEKTAVAPYMKKGTQVYVEGQPDIRVWEKDGKHGAALSLRVLGVQLLGSKPEAQAATAGAPAADIVDDLPF